MNPQGHSAAVKIQFIFSFPEASIERNQVLSESSEYIENANKKKPETVGRLVLLSFIARFC